MEAADAPGSGVGPAVRRGRCGGEARPACGAGRRGPALRRGARPRRPRVGVRQADAAGAAAGVADEDPDDGAAVDVLDASPDAAGALLAVDDASEEDEDDDEPDRPEEDEDDDERASLR